MTTAPMPSLRILPAGNRALLVAPDDHASVGTLVRELRRDPPEGVSDIVPAAQTVLVTTTPHTALVDVEQRIRELLATADVEAAPEDEGGGRIVQIPVRYDGDDLDDVAALLGIGVDEVIAEHTTQIWRCAFIGFAPGFGYLESNRTGLAVPRRTESRTAVPAGAVALADGYSAVYPRRSPGGWQIIGTTGLALWDLNRPEPALLHPGTHVQFVDEARR